MSLLTKTKTKSEVRTRQKYIDLVMSNKAVGTQKQFLREIKFFDKFCFEHYSNWDKYDMHLVDGDMIISELIHKIEVPEDRVFKALEVLQGYLNVRRLVCQASSLRSSIPYVINYMYWMGMRLDQKDLKVGLHYPKRLIRERYSLVMHEVSMILDASVFERQALYCGLISTGMRIGEILAVRKRDLRLYKNHFFVKIHAELTKTSTERETIMSMEATDMIMERYNSIGKDELLYIPTSIKAREMNEFIIFHRLWQRLQIGTKEFHPTLHRFRGYFFKLATKMVDSDYAHRMIGHGGYLPEYGDLTDDEKLDYYLQVEPELTVKDYYKKKLHDTTLEDRIQELELKLQVKELQPRLPVSKL